MVEIYMKVAGAPDPGEKRQKKAETDEQMGVREGPKLQQNRQKGEICI